jgi:hypothetical protein
MGETIIIVGKATIKAKTHAFSQIVIIFATIPTLNTLITKDMIPDISNAIKNKNTIL